MKLVTYLIEVYKKLSHILLGIDISSKLVPSQQCDQKKLPNVYKSCPKMS